MSGKKLDFDPALCINSDITPVFNKQPFNGFPIEVYQQVGRVEDGATLISIDRSYTLGLNAKELVGRKSNEKTNALIERGFETGLQTGEELLSLAQKHRISDQDSIQYLAHKWGKKPQELVFPTQFGWKTITTSDNSSILVSPNRELTDVVRYVDLAELIDQDKTSVTNSITKYALASYYYFGAPLIVSQLEAHEVDLNSLKPNFLTYFLQNKDGDDAENDLQSLAKVIDYLKNTPRSNLSYFWNVNTNQRLLSEIAPSMAKIPTANYSHAWTTVLEHLGRCSGIDSDRRSVNQSLAIIHDGLMTLSNPNYVNRSPIPDNLKTAVLDSPVEFTDAYFKALYGKEHGQDLAILEAGSRTFKSMISESEINPMIIEKKASDILAKTESKDLDMPDSTDLRDLYHLLVMAKNGVNVESPFIQKAVEFFWNRNLKTTFAEAKEALNSKS